MLKNVVPVRRVLPLRNVLFMWRLLSLLRALCLWKIFFLSRSVVPIKSVKRSGWVFSLWPDLQVPKRKEISQLLTEWDLGMRLVLSLCRVYLVLWRVVLLLRVLSLWRVLALWRVLFLVRSFVPLTSDMPTTIVDRVVWSTTSGSKALLLLGWPSVT